MGLFTSGSVVLTPFPFSDLSQSKLRPALVLTESGKEDWVLCQITSNPYGDPFAIEISKNSFMEGSLHETSYVRPGKLFTADRVIITRTIGRLVTSEFDKILQAVIALFASKLRK